MSFETGRSDRQPIFNLPPATKVLIVLNLVIHGARFLLSPGQDDLLIVLFGFTPVRLIDPDPFFWTAILSVLTYQFLHGGFTHIAMNMLGLAPFGAGVERRLGAYRFVVFYLLCGVAGAALQFAVDPNAEVPLIGASAAVSGLFGGILRFGEFRQGFWTIVTLWLVMNVAVGMLGAPGVDAPIAWIAHIGGFVCGLVLFPVFERFRRY